VPTWLTYPSSSWHQITPAEAGLDADAFAAAVAAVPVQAAGWGGTAPAAHEYGAALTRGGYLVHTWGDPTFKTPSASLGKCLTRALLGLTAEAGLVDPDAPIREVWTGEGELSHPHKYLDRGLHRDLTWRHLINHYGGFVIESGFHWRNRTLFHETLPEGVNWTGDPVFDNYAQTPPGAMERYSSAGYWRLGQALTALWNRDLKDILQERLLGKLGITADRWDWTPGRVLLETRDWYPDFPGYGEYVDDPWEIGGIVVRGGPGWVVMSPLDLARFGLLVATGGLWEGERIIGANWLQGHGGVDIHVVGGDPETFVTMAKTNVRQFPFGNEIGWRGKFEFPRELVVRPVEP
jgi:CubicO group peptidase (beta-lactamase class C family)